MNDLYADNITEQLRRWDNGDTIFTIELGGLGPGYEQVMQIAAIEFARAAKDLPDMNNNDKESTAKFRAVCDEVLQKIDGDLGGMTGAQFGQSVWLAWQWCFNGGPKALVERAKKLDKGDQVIQCSKHFHKTPL